MPGMRLRGSYFSRAVLDSLSRRANSPSSPLAYPDLVSTAVYRFDSQTLAAADTSGRGDAPRFAICDR